MHNSLIITMHYFVLSHFLAINKKKQESLERPTLYIYYEYYQSSIQKVLFIEFFFCGGFKQVFFLSDLDSSLCQNLLERFIKKNCTSIGTFSHKIDSLNI